MKIVTWKALFALMSPSPIFEAVAELAEVMLWMNNVQSHSRKQVTLVSQIEEAS
jgi:hypothetical protein